MGNLTRATLRNALALLTVTAALLLGGCGDPAPQTSDTSSASAARSGDASGAAGITKARIVNADSEPHNWLAHGRTYSEQRFSPLDDINEETVSDLALAWSWKTGTFRGLEASPIVVDGVMFTTGSWSKVFAHDAKTGELLWEHDPMVPRDWGKYACCDVVNRGAAVYQGKVISGTIDGRLIALDAEDGSVVWETLTIDPDRPYTITGAPRVVNDLVIIGNGGAEYGVRGYITAYAVDSGEEVWRFYTVPGNPDEPFEGKHLEAAADTWRGGKWWEVGGGGTVWDSMAFDPELNLLYIGTGNGSPWNRYIRSPGGGDNLYLSSMVAINPDTGEMAWHYQTTPGDNWDYTATQHMILADIEINGAERKVIMQAPKNGFFYVVDRTTGEFISAEAYVPVNWASHVDPETGRPVETPAGSYADETKRVRPAPYGGHNWHPMAYNPNTGLVYIPALDLSFKYGQDNAFDYRNGEWNTGVDFRVNPQPADTVAGQAADVADVRGHLAAWDPVAQKEVWRVQHPQAWNSGLLTTAGNLVFQGRSDGYFAAYRASDGELMWETDVKTGIIAPPVSYAIDGEQYVAVMAGWGGTYALASGVPKHRNNILQEGRLMVFKLGGEAEMPQVNVAYLDIPEPPADIQGSAEELAEGAELYSQYCSVCHGTGVTSSGPLPDLKYASADIHAAWDAIVRQGAFIGKGMARFDHVLSEQQAKNIQAYVVQTTRTTIAVCKGTYREQFPELLNNACVRGVDDAQAAGE